MIEIPVDLGPRRYVISIGHGLAGMLGEILRGLKGRRLAVVSSPRIWALHGARVEGSLRPLGPLSRVLVPEGEKNKSLRTLASVHDAFLKAGLGRDGVVVAFGGGVVGDVSGFAAATYMRGVDWVQLPTTLLAMVDSSIGGKVGVNHPRAKNLIGAFHQPRAVVVDPSFLATLAPREVASGAYEILKAGLIADRSLVAAFGRAAPPPREWGRTEWENALASACRIKADIVERDERESGLRRVLNLGHTLGHALETVTSYRRFTHGEAVGWGLVGASWIAWRRGLLTDPAFEIILESVDRIGRRPPVADLKPGEILRAVTRDKKARAGRVPFILPKGLGRVVVRDDVAAAEIRSALQSMTRREAGHAEAGAHRGVSRRPPGAGGGAPSGGGGGSRPRRRPRSARRR